MIKVLVVDDSALVCAVLSEIINQSQYCETVGIAKDAYAAKELVKTHTPDVITLDINMPKVSGLVFLEKLMLAQPTPVVMVSTLTEAGAPETLKALELGAIDYIAKPKTGISQGLHAYSQELITKIRAAATARVRRPMRPTKPIPAIAPIPSGIAVNQLVIALGASTGGTEAIKTILSQLPAAFPPVVITQHMPAGFTRTFAERLDSLCKLKVKEAEHNEFLQANYVYIAKGDRHLTFEGSSRGIIVKLSDSGLVSGHQPSVDVMFKSLAHVVQGNCIAALLTGMGRDGADGLLALKNAGAETFAQDKETCTVYGMPAAAINNGAAKQSVSLPLLGAKIAASVRTKTTEKEPIC